MYKMLIDKIIDSISVVDMHDLKPRAGKARVNLLIMYKMLIDKIKVISIVFFKLVFILICDLL